MLDININAGPHFCVQQCFYSSPIWKSILKFGHIFQASDSYIDFFHLKAFSPPEGHRSFLCSLEDGLWGQISKHQILPNLP